MLIQEVTANTDNSKAERKGRTRATRYTASDRAMRGLVGDGVRSSDERQHRHTVDSSCSLA